MEPVLRLGVKEFNTKFDELWGSTKNELFKLEVLQDYQEDHGDLYQLFLKNDVELLKSKLRELWKNDRPSFTWNRVHVVELPLSEYMRFELTAYEIWEELGVNIYITTFDAIKNVLSKPIFEDFLIFDNEHLFVNRFDDKANFLYSDYSIDKELLRKYIDFKNDLMGLVKPVKMSATETK